MSEITIVGPLPSPQCAHNSRAHYMVKARAVKAIRSLTAWTAKSEVLARKWDGMKPVVIDIVYACCRGCGGYEPRDIANALDAIKGGVDGLVDAGVMPDDSRKWLTIGRLELKTSKAECQALGGAGVYYTVRSV